MKSAADLRWERKQTAALRRKELRTRAVAHLGGKCRICSYDGCVSAFDFHHVDPMGKDFSISDRMTSWAAIERELEKCVLLCCRCHREVHDGYHPTYLVYEDTDRGQLDLGADDYDEPYEAASV